MTFNLQQGIRIINLAGLLILNYTFQLSITRIYSNQKTFIKYNIPDDGDITSVSSAKYAVNFANKFDHEDFILSGDAETNEYELLKIKEYLRQLEKNKSKNRIIKVHILQSVRYESFISLLSLLYQENCRRYFECDNYFYIFPNTAFRK